jgi:hypothetical protein
MELIEDTDKSSGKVSSTTIREFLMKKKTNLKIRIELFIGRNGFDYLRILFVLRVSK